MSKRWRVVYAILSCAWAGSALAGVGPWTLNEGDRSLYLGMSAESWSSLSGNSGSAIDVGAPVMSTEGLAILSYGLAPAAEVEVKAGLGSSSVGRLDASTCVEVGADACASSTGLTPIELRVKGRALDELAGAPLSLALGLGLRFAEWTLADRHRLTALGDGQTDIAPFVAVGRSGGLGGWSYGTFLELGYAARLPVARVPDLGGLKVPGDELRGSAELLIYISPYLAFGPALDVVHRLSGVGLGAVDLSDVDRYTALQVTAIRPGGKLLLRSRGALSVALSAFGVALARNNPRDAFTISAGIGIFQAAH